MTNKTFPTEAEAEAFAARLGPIIVDDPPGRFNAEIVLGDGNPFKRGTPEWRAYARGFAAASA